MTSGEGVIYVTYYIEGSHVQVLQPVHGRCVLYMNTCMGSGIMNIDPVWP